MAARRERSLTLATGRGLSQDGLSRLAGRRCRSSSCLTRVFVAVLAEAGAPRQAAGRRVLVDYDEVMMGDTAE